MIQLVEGFIGDYRQTQIRPGRKATTDILKMLLNPEAHMKQTKLPKGKKKNCYLHKLETEQTSTYILCLR